MDHLPLDIFFETLQNTDSKEQAFQALKRTLIKRKLQIKDEKEGDVEKEFEELWALKEKERILRNIK